MVATTMDGDLLSPGKALARYTRYENGRTEYLDRARDCAVVTIPNLMLPQGHSPGAKLYTPYQSAGAEGVNTLSSKLVLSFFPPNAPFFRQRPTPEVQAEIDESEDQSAGLKMEEDLAAYERTVMQNIEETGDRVTITEAAKQLLLAGNVLIKQSTDEHMMLWRLDKYVVRRKRNGQPLEIIIKETYFTDTLDDEVQAMVTGRDKSDTSDATTDIYTHLELKGNMWHEYQEVEGNIVPGTEGTYRPDVFPYLALRLIEESGEDYGRGYAEQFLGDLVSLESLSQSIQDGSEAAARLLILVNPNGTTSLRVVAEAENGAVRAGNAEDVSAVRMDKASDFSVALSRISTLEQRIARAFLSDAVVQRDAERVTAEEIRKVSQMLEDALGGVYSTLTQSFQLPYIKTRIKMLERAKKVPKLPEGLTQLIITTGMEALGRGHELNRLVGWATGMSQTFGPESLAQVSKPMEFARRLALAHGLETKGLMKTAEELQAEQQAAQAQANEQQFMNNATGPAVQALGRMAEQGNQPT